MGPLRWSDELCVGIREIDEQHKSWMGMVNELYKAVEAQRDSKALGDIIDGLFHYAKAHFALEEKYMEAFGYEGLAEHRREHEQLMMKLTEIQGRFDPDGQDNSLVTYELIDVIGEWLQHHLMYVDMKYVPTFRRHGMR